MIRPRFHQLAFVPCSGSHSYLTLSVPSDPPHWISAPTDEAPRPFAPRLVFSELALGASCGPRAA